LFCRFSVTWCTRTYAHSDIRTSMQLILLTPLVYHHKYMVHALTLIIVYLYFFYHYVRIHFFANSCIKDNYYYYYYYYSYYALLVLLYAYDYIYHVCHFFHNIKMHFSVTIKLKRTTTTTTTTIIVIIIIIIIIIIITTTYLCIWLYLLRYVFSFECTNSFFRYT